MKDKSFDEPEENHSLRTEVLDAEDHSLDVGDHTLDAETDTLTIKKDVEKKEELVPVKHLTNFHKFIRFTFFPICSWFCYLTIMWVVYRIFNLESACQTKPKEYDEENKELLDRADKDLNDVEWKECDSFGYCVTSCLPDMLCAGVAFTFALSQVLPPVSKKTKARLYYVIFNTINFCILSTNVCLFQRDTLIKSYRMATSIWTVCNITSLCVCSQIAEKHSRVWKPFVVVMGYNTFFFFFNIFFLSTVVLQAQGMALSLLITCFPLYLMTMEVVLGKILQKQGLISELNSTQQHIAARIIISVFEGTKYAFILYTFTEVHLGAYIGNMLYGSFIEVIRRSRLTLIVPYTIRNFFVKRLSKGNKPPTLWVLGTRPLFKRRLIGVKYEAEYLPALCIIFCRLTHWAPITQEGNHIDSYGQIDPDFYLPVWVFCAMIIAEMLSDFGTYLCSKYGKLNTVYHEFNEDYQSNFAANAISVLLTMNVILPQSSVFYSYRTNN